MLRVAVCFFLASAPLYGACQIYAGSSAQSGAIVLSNFVSSEASVVLVPAPPTPDLQVGFPVPAPAIAARDSGRLVSAEMQRIVESAATRSAVAAPLIHAVIAAESNYVRNAVSSRGAMGLMQLMPATARRFGAADPFDPGQNVSAGAAYLKWLMGVFGDDLELVLAAYNAGEQAVIKAGRRVPPYPETQAYVKKIMAALRREATVAL